MHMVFTFVITLQMGDRIEILTNKNARPSRDWMTLVKTPSARAKIRKNLVRRYSMTIGISVYPGLDSRKSLEESVALAIKENLK